MLVVAVIKNNPKKTYIMENFENKPQVQKERHGCVTAWLILMIVLNSIVALIYLFALIKTENSTIPGSILFILTILSIANVIFSILLFRWKKIGFTGFLITAVIVFFINLYIGLGLTQSIMGLLGIGILYAILQIKKDNVSAWENLE